MLDQNVERYRRWFEYEKDCHAKVLRSLETVPVARRSSPEYQKAIDLLGHVVAARQLWLFRFGFSKEKPEQIFPKEAKVSDVREALHQVEQIWDEYLRGVTGEDLAKTFEYQSIDGGWFRNTTEDLLTQLFGHSWYHRGQIAALVRLSGGEPAKTDFVFWAREAVPQPRTH